MRTKNKIIKEVIQCAETNGWHVDAEKHQDKNIFIFEFSQFTPAGQDFFFSATMQGRSLESLVSDMEEYYEGFDADSEAYLWLERQRARQKRRTIPYESRSDRHGSSRGDGL